MFICRKAKLIDKGKAESWKIKAVARYLQAELIFEREFFPILDKISKERKLPCLAASSF